MARPGKPILWLGKYLSLVLSLPAYMAAGYLLGRLAGHWLHIPLLHAAGIVLGLAGGLFQILRELARDERAK